MIHEVILNRSPKEAKPQKEMYSFSHVWQEKKNILTDGTAVPSSVGIRCGGYFLFDGNGAISDARKALHYGLETACFRLSDAAVPVNISLFTQRTEDFLQEINRILEESESPFRIKALAFTQMDWCVQPQISGAGRYSGFIIGQSGTREVTVHAPLGIEGEWQCVCGVYNAQKKRKCETCKIPRPRWRI